MTAPTWENALGQFQADLRQNGLAENTVLGYVQDLRGLFRWLHAGRNGQDATPAALRAQDVEAYLRYLRQDQRQAAASINRCLQSIRRFTRFARTAGLVEDDPVAGLTLLERPQTHQVQVLGAAAIEGLTAALEHRSQRTYARDRAIIHTLLAAGLRVGELVDLRMQDLELHNGQGSVHVPGKNRRPARTISLPAPACQAINAYLADPRPAQAERVFLNRHHKALSARMVQQIVAEVGKTLGLDICAQTLRDTYAVRLWQASGDLNLVTASLGLKRPEAVLRYINAKEVVPE